MKKIISIFCSLALFIAPQFLSAQVIQKEINMSFGPQNAYTQDHQDADDKQVEKAWESIIKEYDGKVKKNRKSDEFESLEVLIPSISRTPINIYMTIEERKEMTSTSVFFDNGTAFVNENNASEASMNIEKILTEFGYAVQKIAVEDLMKDEEKNFKKLEKEAEKLEKQNKKLHEDIEDYQAKIVEAESDIEKNLADQDNKQMEIKTQSKLLEDIKEKLNNIGKN